MKNEEIKDEFSARGLQEAKSKLDVMKLPEAERRACERYLEDLSYQASTIQSAYGIGKKEGWKEGREKGLEAGKEESRRQIAKAMKGDDVSIEAIVKTTVMSADEIAGL